ncbi:transglutaminaseTgpA domain-containing protein [Deinococcus knuensis]|uniref:Transglutaminase n=1 Tax=Deinococcus knuensis TaxID=1837380 RepID=A0ABQ2SAC6_9DEIO|nr:transglutaminaseTgpA domain-containing protein [Deinococcus knuensis]GGS14218.1 transglutaminase [Deinococcus knuensis]
MSAALHLRPTGFGLAFLILILLTLIGCVNYGLSLGYGLTFLLGGVWVITAAQAMRAARSLTLTVRPAGPAHAGLPASLNVQAQASGDSGTLEVRLRGQGRELRAALHVPAGGAALTVAFPASVRGPLTLQVGAWAQDRLGLWRAALPARPDPVTLLVWPAPESPVPPVPDRAAPGVGGDGHRGPGDEEFAGLRPYQPGDSPRQVSWRHVARTGQLLTRETDAARGHATDLHWQDAPGDAEARASRLSGWAQHLSALGTPFALTLPGTHLKAASGEAHLHAALNALATVDPLPAAPVPARGAARLVSHAATLVAQATPPTLLALAVTLAPGALRQPVWITLPIALLLAHALARVLPRPGRTLDPLPVWLLALLAVGGAAALIATQGTLLGRDAGTAFLGLLIALKTAESRSSRDGRILILLGLFMTSTHYFYSQGPLSALHTLISAAFLLAAAPAWIAPVTSGPASTPAAPGGEGRRTHLRDSLLGAGRLLALAAPLALVLFVLFPRPDRPLWQLPVQGQATTGLSNEISAGEYSNLAQNSAVAFRADFQGALPTPDQRYWRGPVYEAYDGRTWRQVRAPGRTPSVDVTGPPLNYTLTLEPSGNPWLLALDVPLTVPDGAFLTNAFQAVTPRPVTTRRRVELQSRAARLGVQEDPDRLAFDLQLPAGQNPRAVALAASWRGLNPEARVQAGLDLLRSGGFTYTLTPPLLPEQDRVDAFLFSSRQGFCEHYASSFAFLMRAAGLSARVVGGYQGGEQNGSYLIVRQQDAHAWTEIWLPGQGWVRVDPTAVVAPARVSAGLSTALTRPQAAAPTAPGTLKRLQLRLDAIQNRWNDLVVDYDGDRQSDLLTRAGLGGVGSTPYLLLLPTLIALTLLPALLLARRRARPSDPASRALHDLSVRLHLPRAPGETPTAYMTRATTQHPHLHAALQDVLNAYHAARYAPHPTPDTLTRLRRAVRNVRR